MAENESKTKRESNKDVDSEENEAIDEVTMDSEDSSSDDEENVKRAQIQELVKQVNENQYMYDSHVNLIKALREVGELEELRNARQRMSRLFPLTEELWLDWLKDEILIETNEEERNELYKLFERATKDYLSVPIWLEYVQYTIGGMSLSNGTEKIREVFESALVACGLHVRSGAMIWETYREFENAILAGLLPEPGVDPSVELQEKFSTQHNRVDALFKRQLSVPLLEMKETYREYKEWLQEEPDKYVTQSYNKAISKLKKIQDYEDSLLQAEPPRLQEYEAYIKFEEEEGEPTRIQILYERALQENCLIPKLWLQYTNYLDTKLGMSRVSLPVYERAVRNCTWCVQLWQKYLLCLERSDAEYNKVKEVFEAALLSGFTLGSEYLLIWTTFLDYLRRRIKWQSDHEEDLETFRLTAQKAIEQLDYYGQDGDPNSTLRQFWANIEARHCKNMEKSRELWAEVMTLGHANQAALWLEHYRFERANGDNKHSRRVLQRALNSVTDWPESIVDAYINFEREEGNLEQYDQAVSRCEARMQRISENREKESEKEVVQQESKKKGKIVKRNQKGDEKNQQHKPQNKKFEQQQLKVSTSANKRKHEESPNKSENEFKVPTPVKQAKDGPPPGFKGERSAPPPGFKGERSAPPPGFKAENGSGDTLNEPPEKKVKIESSSAGEGQSFQHDTSADFRTAFVSNLQFSVDETQIKDFFLKCGEIEEIRLIKTMQGKSKGFAYVQFKEELGMTNALTYDRNPINGRPVFVSKCEDRSNKSRADKFKFGTGLEKNKLFVKNLPFTVNEEALRTMFAVHGELRDVRLVTYRTGKPKGLAYIEYIDETDAQKALLKMDGILVGEHEISVSISNPPARKTHESDDATTSFIPSLGGGKKETTSRGVARTQVMLMPRSVKKSVQTSQTQNSSSSNTQPNSASSSATQNSGSDPASKSSQMSNADFRNMLLKK